jgi:PAS domain S-box-containing protein
MKEHHSNKTTKQALQQDYLLSKISSLEASEAELKRQLKELKERELFQKTLLDNTPLPYQSLDQEGKILNVNNAWLEILGYRREEVLGKFIGDFLDPEWLPVLEKNFTQFIQQGYIHDVEFKMQHKSGKFIYISNDGYIGKNTDGSFLQTYCVFHDITANKKAQEKIKTSEKKFENLLEHTNDSIFIGNKNGDLIKVNQAASLLTGFSKEELLQKNMQDLFPSEVLIKKPLRYDLLLEGKSLIKQRKLKTKKGKFISIEMNSNKMPDGNYISVMRDITQRLKESENLRTSELRFRSMIEYSFEGIGLIDNKYIFTYSNPNLSKIFGYPIDEIVGADFRKFLTQESLDLVSSRYQKRQAKESVPSRYEFTIKRKNGEIRNVEISSSVITDVENKPQTLVQLIDNTENKKRQKELEIKEKQFRTVIESAGDAIFVADYHSEQILLVNQQACKVLEYSQEELLGKKVSELDPYFNPNKHFSNIWEKLVPGEPINIEVFHKRKNGTVFPVEVRTGIIDYNGKKAILGFARDISERKKAEKSLQESETRFKSLFENLGDAVYVTKTGGKNTGDILQVNEAAVKQTGYSKAELLKLNIPKDLYIQGTASTELNEQNDLLEKGEVISSIEKKRRKDGTEYWTEVIVTPTEINGELIGLSINRDITERKRADQIQKILYRISDAVVNTKNLHDLILIIQKELGTILDTRNFYVALYNSEQNTFSLPIILDELKETSSFPAGKTFSSYIIKTQKPLLANQKKINEMLARGEVELVGTPAKVWLGVPLKHENNTVGVLAVQSYTDENAFTEEDLRLLEFVSDQVSVSIHRKKAEDDLIKALEKATEADRLKSAFLANMSHEIRTPMNGILGFSELLKQPDLPKEDQHHFIQIIENSGKRMLNIINDLIDISKIEAGQTTLNRTKVEINKQMDYLYTFFKPEAESKGIELKYRKGLNSPDDIIFSDREKIYAILINLIKNAVKYTHRGSILFGYEKQGNKLEFYVKDTGIGIASDRQKAIFDRFVQADIEDKEVYEGAGLGLAITKAYIEMLGGSIKLTSKEGEGSLFYFSLPYHKEEISNQEPIKPKEIPSPENKNLKILIVEDEKYSDEYLSLLLKNRSKDIHHAANGIEALELCRNIPDFDLILMDIKMPKLDGYATTQEIRKFNSKVQIIAQTAYALEGEKEKALEAGCNAYISKPIRKNELIQLIDNLFKQS